MRRFDWGVPRLLVTMAVVVAGLAYVGKFVTADPVANRRPGEPFTGSWWFPRGGPYILGFDSPGGPAKLEIDGQPVVQGTGEQKVRLIYSPGVHAMTFDAPAGARLLWHPPGRRGALEYVPGSSISPQPPELATFTAPGSDIGAALVATAILLVIVFGGLSLARPIVHGRGGPGTMIFVVALVARLYGLGDAGQTWDEDEYWSSGRNYVINVLRHDASAEAWHGNFQHPPLTKYIAGVGALWVDGFAVSRFLFALMGAGTCVLAFAIGRRLFSTRVGAFAGVCAALMPHLIAHSRIIGHETPSAFLWSLGVWLALRVNDPHNRDEEVHYMPPGAADLLVRLAAVGVAVGLAAATRYTNLLLAPLVGALVLLTTPRDRLVKTAALGIVTAPLVAAAVFFAIWPLMWHAPIENIRAGYEIMRQQHLAEPYLGSVVQRPPWHYFPVYLMATTPVVLLAAAFLGGGVRAVLLREKGLLLLLLWLVAPFGVAFSPVKQDGVRYILPALPALAVAAAAGIDLLAVRSRNIIAALALVLGLVGYLGFTCFRIQPYYLDYFGEQVGGPAAVQKKRWFEVGWWGEGIANAVEHVNARAHKGDVVARLVYPTHVTWFREDLWEHLVEQPGTVDWYVVNDMWELERGTFVPPPGVRLVYQVEAQRASLVRVYHREN